MKSLILGWLLFFGAFSNYEYEYVKIINLQRKPIVTVTLNGKKAYFLLDTGSDITMLNKEDSKKYGFRHLLHKGERHAAIGIGGKTDDISSATNVQLILGSTRIITRYLSYDMSAIIENTLKNSGIRIAGIIGADAMKRYGIIIDFKNRQVGILTKAAKNRKNRDI